jgi:hypothetical protein
MAAGATKHPRALASTRDPGYAWISSQLVGSLVAALVAEQKSAHDSRELLRFVLLESAGDGRERCCSPEEQQRRETARELLSLRACTSVAGVRGGSALIPECLQTGWAAITTAVCGSVRVQQTAGVRL